jgi:hypothetical protein
VSGSLSTYLETALLNHAFGGPDYVPPTAIYAALFLAAPTADGGGNEVTGGGYVRMPVSFGAPAGSPPTLNNPNAVQWPAASTDWGAVVAGGVYDAASAGNFLGFGVLVSAVDGVTAVPLTVTAGMIFQIPATGLVLGFTVPASSALPFTPPTTRRLSMRPMRGQVIDGAGVARQGIVMGAARP